jgi:hypothetical protein
LYREVEIGSTFLTRRGAMRKIGGVLRDGIFERPVSDSTPYVIFRSRRTATRTAAASWRRDFSA